MRHIVFVSSVLASFSLVVACADGAAIDDPSKKASEQEVGLFGESGSGSDCGGLQVRSNGACKGGADGARSELAQPADEGEENPPTGSSSGEVPGGSSSGGVPGGSSSGGPPPQPACVMNGLSSRAKSLTANVLGLARVQLNDTGLLTAPGTEHRQNVTLGLPPLVGAGVVSTTAIVSASGASANATIANADIDLGAAQLGAALGNLSLRAALGPLDVHADAFKTDAAAGCGFASGQSTIANLRINDADVLVSGEANQTIRLFTQNLLGLDVKIVINEQIANPNGGILVNALHASIKVGLAPLLTTIADVVVSSAEANASCTCE